MQHKKTLPNLKSQVGQSVIESVLIIFLLFGFTLIVSQQMRDNQVIRNLVSGPWQNLAGLLQNGQWMPVQDSMQLHPTQYIRHASMTEAE